MEPNANTYRCPNSCCYCLLHSVCCCCDHVNLMWNQVCRPMAIRILGTISLSSNLEKEHLLNDYVFNQKIEYYFSCWLAMGLIL